MLHLWPSFSVQASHKLLLLLNVELLLTLWHGLCPEKDDQMVSAIIREWVFSSW